MSKFAELQKYYASEAPMSLVREPDPKKLEHLYKDEEGSDKAKEAAKDDGHVEGSEEFIEAVKRLQESINKKNSQRSKASSKNIEESLEKGKRGPLSTNDAFAVATKIGIDRGEAEAGDRRELGLAPPHGKGSWRHGGPAAAIRDRRAKAIARRMKWQYLGKSLVKDNSLEKVSPGLERLLAFGAGWALSGDVVNRDVPADLVREWERAVNRQASDDERKKIERKIKSRLRKAEDTPQAFNSLTEFWLQKDHAPVPPRIGLMWDAVKHRWTRPERIGRTVWELSGHKRIRGTGTGVHERSVKVGGIGGRGAGSATAGRRFRSIGDVGKLNVHEAKHPAFKRLKEFARRKKKHAKT
jgi:hypothetical protein